MDLLQTVRKEGSRGGVDFKWDDVRSSQHRENYLGHSLMAPVGRWQKGKDLNWYAKAEDAEKTPEDLAADEQQRRKEELRKVKEAEEDAMARALGLPVPDRSANTEPLGIMANRHLPRAQRTKEDHEIGMIGNERDGGVESQNDTAEDDQIRETGVAIDIVGMAIGIDLVSINDIDHAVETVGTTTDGAVESVERMTDLESVEGTTDHAVEHHHDNKVRLVDSVDDSTSATANAVLQDPVPHIVRGRGDEVTTTDER
ncbi:hypothetical protein AMS68_008019 [Peltaster fructicola]|uniref:Multiple myeloma tumor-associated protein 2-like N-terminal domain-containing protein n=1 Tax=Peltaster fructicola TaxID=286661 RepID=A0A6H0Y623_9PEZI|nr:hypothetical protein AMS68_008019 [Peltaster fructicola]